MDVERRVSVDQVDRPALKELIELLGLAIEAIRLTARGQAIREARYVGR